MQSIDKIRKEVDIESEQSEDAYSFGLYLIAFVMIILIAAGIYINTPFFKDEVSPQHKQNNMNNIY